MNIEDELAGVDGLHEFLQLSIVRVRRVGYLEVEGQVLVILIVPASQNDENSGLLPIALVDAKQTKYTDQHGFLWQFNFEILTHELSSRG